MNIPSAGRKRDKLIALMKNMRSEVECAGHTIPCWSTDRNDAWELWDELPKGKFYAEVGFACSIGIYYLSNKLEDIREWLPTYIIEGFSFADVVSKIWIEWKKGEKKEKGNAKKN